MNFYIITLFPDSIQPYLESSIIGRAVKSKKIKASVIDIRDFVSSKKRADDRAYGGGPGMVMRAEPIVSAFNSIKSIKGLNKKKTKVIFFEPSGKQFEDKTASNLSKKYKNIVLIAGHYEGIDERTKKIIRAKEYSVADISIGPYVLTGGELPSLVLIDAVSRKIAGVLGKSESLEENRLGVGTPSYTRPEVIKANKKTYKVPKVLLSGHHKDIEKWRNSNRK